MDLIGIKEFLGEDWVRVEEGIASALKSDIDKLDTTNGLILSHSGKQLRPLLAVLVARACNGGLLSDMSIRYAVASELLHNATLLHDDVADNSDFRRGVPTIRRMMGPSVSVLVGDFWLVRAMEEIFADDNTCDMRVVRIFSKTLGDLAEGEMFQLQKAESGDTSEQDYRKIIYNKTASLFEAVGLSAAISVRSPKKVEEAMGRYCTALGMAFQIRDDIFDYHSSPSRIGKPVGVDILEKKITLPLLGAFKDVDSATEQSVRDKVGQIGEHPEFRDGIISFTLAHKGVEYATGVLEQYVSQAKEALGVLQECREKEILAEIAEYVGTRLS